MDDDVHLFVHYKGQGVDQAVYNGEYDEIVDFLDVLKDSYSYRTIEEKVQTIYDRIHDMIEEYEQEH